MSHSKYHMYVIQFLSFLVQVVCLQNRVKCRNSYQYVIPITAVSRKWKGTQ